MLRSSTCRSIVASGTDGLIVDIECRTSNNLPIIVIIGFASKAVAEAKDRIRGAFASCKLELPRRRITLNLAPADIPKADSGLDLAMAVAILAASKQVPNVPTNVAIMGELGLDGRVRAVRGIIGKLLAGRRQGLTEFIIPASNLEQAALIPDLTLYPIEHLGQLQAHLTGSQPIPAILTHEGRLPTPVEVSRNTAITEVIGQAAAKRALCIAAAGGHNLLLIGAPGTGKSLLAKALPSLLPPMSQEEILEATHLNSLASHNYDQLVTQRPLRSPHHTTNHTAMIGGGNSLRPGEISLSHHGVLLLDELPEFSRPTLEALRQPLEDKVISVARIKESLQYPANFILAATANPCPCGYASISATSCICSAAQLQRYRTKFSGPLLDRIDLCCEVSNIGHQELLARPTQTEPDYARHVQAARRLQADRYPVEGTLNSDLTPEEIRRYGRVTASAQDRLTEAATNLQLSTRSYLRVVRVARTIADLEASPIVSDQHITEALHYRYRPATSLV